MLSYMANFIYSYNWIYSFFFFSLDTECTHILVVVNNDVMDMGCIYLFKLFWFFSYNLPYFKFLRKIFSIVQHQFTFPPTVHEVSLFCTSSLALVISCIFYNSYARRCVVVSYCGFGFYFPDDNWCGAPSPAPLGHLYVFFGKMPIQILSSFFIIVSFSVELYEFFMCFVY